MRAGGGRTEGGAVHNRPSDDALYRNGDGSSSSILQEPATAPSPPVLRMYVMGLSLLALCCHRGSPRQSEKNFQPLRVLHYNVNEEQETFKFDSI